MWRKSSLLETLKHGHWFIVVSMKNIKNAVLREMYLKSVLKYEKEILVARNTKAQPLIHRRVHEKHQKRRAQRNIWKTSKAQGANLNTILQFPYVPSLRSATASSFCLLITLPPTSFLFLLITLLWFSTRFNWRARGKLERQSTRVTELQNWNDEAPSNANIETLHIHKRLVPANY